MKNYVPALIAVLAYLSAAILFFTGSDSSLKIIMFLMGSTLLCWQAVILNRQAENKEEDEEDSE